MTPPNPVCVVMAVHRPDPDFLKLQLQSISAQTQPVNWLVLAVSDGASGNLARLYALENGFDEAHVVETSQKLDAVRAFEVGLNYALDLTRETPDAYIALSDQDDFWHAERLKRGVSVLDANPAVMLTHSDARVVDVAGGVLHSSMFMLEKRHRNPGLRGLLYRNNVTGMTATVRRKVVDVAMPIAQQSSVHFYHDLWIALIASTLGEIEFIDEPLVDYRQHRGNVLGAIGALEQDTQRSAAHRMLGVLKGTSLQLNARIREEASGYALARYLAISIQDRVLKSEKDGDLTHGIAVTHPLRTYLRARGFGLRHLADSIILMLQGHIGLARIALGHGVIAAGRLIWALRRSLGVGLRESLATFDKRIYSLSPGVAAPELEAATQETTNVAALTDSRKRASWTPRFDAEHPSLTLLVPSLNPTEAFAGIATAIDIGIGLATKGHHVRLIATDMPIASPETSRRFVLGRLGKAVQVDEVAARITLACGVIGDGKTDYPSISSHKKDVFLATAWWTAHVAQGLIAKFGYSQSRIAYLIQDFEPNFYPWGPEFSDAMATYEMDVLAVFNTVLLRDYFAELRFDCATMPDVLAFRPSIDLEVYSGPRPATHSGPRKLAIYGRPEVPRNMYSTVLEGIDLFLKSEGLTPDDISLVSVGMSHGDVRFDGGHVLESLGKLPFESYSGFLLGVDLGVSLMYSPHPSYPPIEMAASGVRVVTNTFGPKNLGELSSLIASIPATPQDVRDALSKHWHAGPIQPNDRKIDLSALGLEFDDLMARLSIQVAELGILKK